MDRIHVRLLLCFVAGQNTHLNDWQRLGQHRPVQAIKLVIEDSIESRIVQV